MNVDTIEYKLWNSFKIYEFTDTFVHVYFQAVNVENMIDRKGLYA